MGFIQRRIVKAVMAVVAWPKVTLAVAAVVLVGCVALAWGGLRISTDQNKLFSPKVKFFRDYLEFTEKFPENEAIYIVIEPRDPGAQPPVKRWTGLADAIAGRLSTMPRYVQRVESRVGAAELGVQGFLFEEAEFREKSFREFVEFTGLLKTLGEKPGLEALVIGNTPIERFLGAMQQGATMRPEDFRRSAPLVEVVAGSMATALDKPELPVEKTLPDFGALDAETPRRLGYFYEPDRSDPTGRRHILLINVYHVPRFDSLTAISETVEAIRAAAKEEAKAYPEFKVGATGRPALEADEMRTTDRDMHRAEIIAMSVVFVGLIFMLRSVWLAVAAELTLAVAIGWTFGWATGTVGELNLLSLVFVIALIGIGMDYLIQILTRYRREAQRYQRDQAIWVRVFRYVSPPISTACLGAAGAFFVSVFTDFRGAAELGIIAGGGLLLCLLAGYTVLPALLVLFPAKLKMRDPSKRYHAHPPRWVGWQRLLTPALWVVLLVAGIPFGMKAGFDPNLLNLQAPNLESVQLVHKLQAWSAVVMTKDLDMLRKVRDAVAQSPQMASTDSILRAYDTTAWLEARRAQVPQIRWVEPAALKPGELKKVAGQARGLAERYATLAKGDGADRASFAAAEKALRNFADAAGSADSVEAAARRAERLNAWQRAFMEEIRGLAAQFDPPPVDVRKLPEFLREHYQAADGTYALYIYPWADLWQREPLKRFEEDIEARVKAIPGAPAVTGITANVYHTTESIEWSFYKATAMALGLIFILVLLDLRKIGQTLLAISVLALDLPMLVALMGIFGISWNFANFFGLPILIGAGHEYGVFMVHRYREVLHSPRRAWRSWDVSDRALLLCAFVTSSAFAFLMLGQHRGIASLGLVMALGTACIYLATILVVRPVLLWRLERKKVYTSGTPRGEASAKNE